MNIYHICQLLENFDFDIQGQDDNIFFLYNGKITSKTLSLSLWNSLQRFGSLHNLMSNKISSDATENNIPST